MTCGICRACVYHYVWRVLWVLHHAARLTFGCAWRCSGWRTLYEKIGPSAKRFRAAFTQSSNVIPWGTCDSRSVLRTAESAAGVAHEAPLTPGLRQGRYPPLLHSSISICHSAHQCRGGSAVMLRPRRNATSSTTPPRLPRPRPRDLPGKRSSYAAEPHATLPQRLKTEPLLG